MRKKLVTVFMSSLLIMLGGFFIYSTTVEASELITGTFVKAEYEEVQVNKDTVQQVLSKVTVKNDAGRTITLSIDRYAKLSIDTVPVKMDAFKLGMKVEADVQLRRVKTLNGKTDTPSAVIETNGKVIIGVVSTLNRNKKDLSITLDDGRVRNIYLHSDTQLFKNGKLTDIGALYEGDRIKAKFSVYNTNHISELEIMETGIQVAGLYKGTLHRIEPISRKISVRDETKFLNWHWYANAVNSTSSYDYSANTPIYFENQPVPHNQLRKYTNHKVYVATRSKHGKEQVERIIIQKNEERTYYEPLKSFNGNMKQIQLMSAGKFTYHNGSILIRNGRLVEPEALGAYGTAFIAASGPLNNQHANIIHISNDGLNSPNLSDHSIYFGKVSGILGYQLRLSSLSELKQNVWTVAPDSDFYFNNETTVVEDYKQGIITRIPQMDLPFKMGQYGYFYIKNNQVIAAHFTPNTTLTKIVSVGRLAAISPSYTTMDVRNVSQWMNGAWATQGFINKMDIQQATFIKDGEVIQPKDLRSNDRLFIVADSIVKGRIIIVD
ncbi:hypothetical protein DV702_00655 [Sporosarcina sp. PTS2304]|uniref:hypothetical protein n=1 Tax=Sporosarcina sp. PTS2304 TaxID=2283194 RepID=UPI000E0DA7C1|nr:hypothetical protein [Sporosarcina sp. PTS2304]AXH98343.1 hypothetical protein DV702_00655 [Sporosarcina sp. PTS2304]